MTTTQSKELSPQMQFREQLTRMDGEIKTALPPHIPPERFIRVVLTAVNGNADLLKADRRSLFDAAMKAAQDGLLPDGRDGAFVTFKTKDKSTDTWIAKVQWLPMVGGILKKVRNSGELLTIAAHVVHEHDRFEYVLGDDERIEHQPQIAGNRGNPIAVYAIAKTKDGGVYREVMSIDEVQQVRNVSRAKDAGPWKDWWSEMARKTVIRRLAKRLPMSSDLDDLIRRDDDFHDFSGTPADKPHGGFTVIDNPLMDEVPPKQIEASTGPQEAVEVPGAELAGDMDPGEILIELERAYARCGSAKEMEGVELAFAPDLEDSPAPMKKTASAIKARHLDRVKAIK